MKSSLLAAAAAIGATSVFAPAAAAQVYAGAGYTVFQADDSGQDINLGALMGRVGFKTNPFFGVEGEFSIGVQDESFNVLGTPVDIGLESEIGVFAVGHIPVPFLADVFGRVGYHTMTIDANAPGLGSIAEDGSGLAYGGGVQFSPLPFTKLRIEYTRYEPDDGEFDSFGISGLFQF